jgi:hypothetical protein
VKSPLQLPVEACDWTRRYEQLRKNVLASDHGMATDLSGLTVLITRGMAAWMRSWQEPLRCSIAAQREALPMSLSSQSWQEEATRLLVNMALCHLGLKACNG